MSPRMGFVGESYRSQSPNAADQLSMNLYVEKIEVPENQPLVQYPTPGLIQFTSAGSQTRGSINISDIVGYFISDGALYQTPLTATPGPPLFQGNVANDGKPVSMVFYGNQLLIASGGIAYVQFLSGGGLFVVPGLVAVDVAKVDFCDGYFIALVRNTNTFRISAIFDAMVWDPADTAVISVFPGNLVSLKVDHREIWVGSQFASTVYYNNGDPNFPFAVNPSAAVIEAGFGAIDSIVQLDNTLFWLGKDSRGRGIVWRASGYTPTRVSNHAVEYALSTYGDISDAVAYAYQDQGHSFYVIYFPTAEVLPTGTKSATWVYDVATGLWHERGFWDAAHAQYTAHRSWNHMFLFNNHYVGDWATGIIYKMSIDELTDNGAEIRRARRTPHVADEQKWEYHSQIQVYLESGLGPMPPLLDGMGNPRDPIINLRWSDDGGHTWSDDLAIGVGQTGEYKKRVIWRRLGRSRDRIYEVNFSDPIHWRIVDAFLEIEEGTS